MQAITLRQKPAAKYLPGITLPQLNRLATSTETPFMLLRTVVVRHNLRCLKDALPGTDIYYAVKANDHPDIIQALHQQGSRFDISSAAELRTVIAHGVRPEETIHTNPVKSLREFDDAVAMGVDTFVADNPHELDKFSRYPGRAGVLLRFKTPAGGSVVNLSYKFGADLSDIPALLDRIIELNIPFRGFCFHVGSQCLDISLYTSAIRTARDLIETAGRKGLNTEILDIGGGFPVAYTGRVPGIATIGRAIMKELGRSIDPSIKIICEPGRFLSGEAATLFASVIGKAVRDGKTWYYIDDGLYGSFSGRLFDQGKYQILTNRNTTWENAVLAGPTCDSFDVIYKDCLLPPLDPGDILIFPAMGAYCRVSASRFNGLGNVRTVVVDW